MKKKILLSFSVAIISMVFIMVLSGCEFNINDLLTIGQVKEVTPEAPSKNIDSNNGNDTNNSNNTNTNSSYTIKFMDGSSELNYLRQTVSKNGKATKPAEEKLPYKLNQRISYWELNGYPYDFDNVVTSDIALNAIYEYTKEYDNYANSSYNILQTDFYDEYIGYENYPTFDIYSATYQKTNNTNKIDANNKFHLQNGQLGVNLGYNRVSSPGEVNIYFETSLIRNDIKNSIFSVIGANNYTSNSEIFSLTFNNGYLGYESENGKYEYCYSLSINRNYQIRVKLDLTYSNIYVYIDDFEVLNGIYSSANAVNGFCFGNNQNVDMYVDNIAVTYVQNNNSLDELKNEAYLELSKYSSSYEYKNLSYSLRTYVDKYINSFYDEISYAYDINKINSILDNIYTFESAYKHSIPVYPYLGPNNSAYGISEGYFNIIDGFTLDDDIYDQYNNLYFGNYKLEGIYTDSSLKYSAELYYIKNYSYLYAKLGEASLDSSWNVESEAIGQYSIQSGTTITSICTLYGTVTAKYNSANNSCIGFDLSKNGSGYLEISIPYGKRVFVELGISSTSSANTSSNIYLTDSYSKVISPYYFNPYDSNYSSNSDGVMSIYSSQTSSVAYYLNEGIYKFACYDSARGVRLKYIIVSEY